MSDDDAKVTTEGTLEEQDDGEKDDDEGQEVIKVYILKADSGDDDLGESTMKPGGMEKSQTLVSSKKQRFYSASPGSFVISCCLCDSQAAPWTLETLKLMWTKLWS